MHAEDLMRKKLWEWIKHPCGWALAGFYLAAAIAVSGAIVFTIIGKDKSYDFIAYIFYFLAAITFGYAVYTIVIIVPKLKQKIILFVNKYPFINRLYKQYGFRTIVFAIVSLVISVGNAVVNGTIGIINLSVWYGALAAYYFLLTSMRSGVLLYHRKKKKYEANDTAEQLKVREIKTYRTCGILLVLLPLALSFAIAETVRSDRGFVHAGLMIFVSAAYTFYKIIMSVINFFKARRGDDMTVRAIRNVNLADALVSVLALQTAMFYEFSPEKSLGYANAITGAVVCALTAAIGVFMVVSGSIKIKRIKIEEQTDNKWQG